VLQTIHTLLSKQYAKLYPKETFIGVAGTSQALIAVLSQKYKTVGISNKTFFRLKPSVKRAIFEVDNDLSFIRPKIGIILGDLDSEELIENLPPDGLAILNWDDVKSKKLADKCKGEVVYFGTDPEACLIWASNVNIENYKTVFELNYGVEKIKVNYPLLGMHQIYPALASATLGIIEKIPLTRIKLALESLIPSEHGMQAIVGPNGSVILDDTFNSSPIACEAAIDTLMRVPARRRIVVLGEMGEFGEHSDILYRSIAQKIYKEKIDLVILGQGQSEIIADELKNLGFWEEKIMSDLQSGQMVGKLLTTLEKGDVCLIKGSRTVRLDEVVTRIAKKI